MTTASLRTCCTVLFAAAIACGSDDDSNGYTPSGPCDAGLALNATDPVEAARAMGICDGLVSATWTNPNGTAATTGGAFDVGHGIMPSFGSANTPREGTALLALSSGTARTPAQAGYSSTLDKGYVSPLPAGFPNGQAACPAPATTGYDGIALRVVLEVPDGVRFMAFDYSYFTRDYPDLACNSFIDQAGALVSGLSGTSSATNVLLDGAGNPMFVSPTAIQACAASGDFTCPLGTALLAATGFDDHGASGWRRTANLPVSAGSTVELTLMIWDTGDAVFDSTLLLDGFAWVP